MKYESLDDRTGYKEGEIVELTAVELNNLPFNVKMKQLEPIDDGKVLEEACKKASYNILHDELKDKGLSKNRIENVLVKYQSLSELIKNAKNAGIDDMTDEWILSEYGSKSKIKKELKGD